jgi:hypothetical protein
MDREDICREIWREAIEFDSAWVGAYLEGDDPGDDQANTAVRAMVAAGISAEQIQAFAESVRYESAFATLRVLDEAGAFVEEACTLYEDLLISKPGDSSPFAGDALDSDFPGQITGGEGGL